MGFKGRKFEHNGVTLDLEHIISFSSRSNTAGAGFGAGAMAGSFFGPLGTVVGGVAGGVTGFFAGDAISRNERSILEAYLKFYIDNGREPTEEDIKSIEFKRKYKNIDMNMVDMAYINGGLQSDMQTVIAYMASEEGKKHLQEDNPNIAFNQETGLPIMNPETGKPETISSSNSNEYNPYAQWLEQQRMVAEGQELGLLNEQTRIGQQNSEISAQQSMIQQAQLRDQIVEQIKLDRMSKMRQGITPMQIANESLQFTVGNIQANNQQMTAVNRARLAAIQQQGLNPYQAYLNSINSAGYQAQGNVASGMAATDASDMYQQALRYARSQGRNYIKPEDYEMVQGLIKQ